VGLIYEEQAGISGRDLIERDWVLRSDVTNRTGNEIGLSVVVPHRYDYISLFVPFFDISVRFGNLL
jgi:hypothetical protein